MFKSRKSKVATGAAAAALSVFLGAGLALGAPAVNGSGISRGSVTTMRASGGSRNGTTLRDRLSACADHGDIDGDGYCDACGRACPTADSGSSANASSDATPRNAGSGSAGTGSASTATGTNAPARATCPYHVDNDSDGICDNCAGACPSNGSSTRARHGYGSGRHHGAAQNDNGGGHGYHHGC